MHAQRRFLAVALLIASLAAGSFERADARAWARRPPGRGPSILDNDDRMDVNNLDMRVTNHGSIAYDLTTGNGGLIYPRGSGTTAVFAAGIWLGAKVNGEIRVALAEYGQEFTPGPMQNGTFIADQPAFRNFRFSASSPLSAGDLADYQAQGGPVDGNGDPVLFGDAQIWSVFNDANPALHTLVSGSTAPLGVEVKQTVYAYNRAGALGNVIYIRWVLTNKSADRFDSTYVSFWSDPDLGGASDDLVGCDTTLAMGYCYNATNNDLVYGSRPPAVGYLLLRGPRIERSPGVSDTLGMTSFNKYIGGTDPQSPEETFNYLRGVARDGAPLHVLNDPSLPVTTFAVSGLNPGAASSPTNWLDSNPADRRLAVTAGPFTMNPGDAQDLLVAICVGQGTDRLASIGALRHVATLARLIAAPALQADLAIAPSTINLLSLAPWVTAFIEPHGFDPASIDPASVTLEGVHADPATASIVDHDTDGLPELEVRFARRDLDPFLAPGTVTLVMNGLLVGGGAVSASADVRVIRPARGPLAPWITPNPMNPTGSLRFQTSVAGRVTVRLYDARGRVVRTLADQSFPAGVHEVALDGRGEGGHNLGSGVYWFRIEAVEATATGRLVVLR